MMAALFNLLFRLIDVLPGAITRWYMPKIRARFGASRLTRLRPAGRRQLLVDISVIQRHDAGTGVQRMVRGVLTQLLANPPEDFVVRLVAATWKQRYRYLEWDGAESERTWGGEVRVESGDVFLGLDLSAHIIPRHLQQLIAWKEQGAVFHFVIYDLLPLHHQEWFTAKLALAFRRWIAAVAVLSDSVICLSRSVENNLATWLESYYGIAVGDVRSQIVPVGCDVPKSARSVGFPPDFQQLISKIRVNKTVLMVGTLEPRKGHAQAVDAFDLLWNSGRNYNFVIVGAAGWKTEPLQARLRNHPQRNKHLFWLDDASDEALVELYATCHGIIVPSLAEGFGLPLIEALGHGKPVLARDIPVFRERKQAGIDFFSGFDPESLSMALIRWLDEIRASGGGVPIDALHSWRDTTLAIIEGIDLSLQKTSERNDVTSSIAE